MFIPFESSAPSDFAVFQPDVARCIFDLPIMLHLMYELLALRRSSSTTNFRILAIEAYRNGLERPALGLDIEEPNHDRLNG